MSLSSCAHWCGHRFSGTFFDIFYICSFQLEFFSFVRNFIDFDIINLIDKFMSTKSFHFIIILFCVWFLNNYLFISFKSYFANLATDRVSTIGETVYVLNWFDQPIEMQKYLILMILQSHEPISFSGFGIVFAQLDSFGKVRTHIQFTSNT